MVIVVLSRAVSAAPSAEIVVFPHSDARQSFRELQKDHNDAPALPPLRSRASSAEASSVTSFTDSSAASSAVLSAAVRGWDVVAARELCGLRTSTRRVLR